MEEGFLLDFARRVCNFHLSFLVKEAFQVSDKKSPEDANILRDASSRGNDDDDDDDDDDNDDELAFEMKLWKMETKSSRVG